MLKDYIIGASILAFLSVAAATTFGQDVKVEKYQLPNGMTVILHEDHSLPMAAINTWYYVGSKDEPPGRSGFAHLFEHLMFMGTRRVPGGDFDTIMETGGGANNASTSEDRTNYFSFGPPELLPTLLWLDADRLEELGKEMTQEKLDKQREVVRNERRQTSEMLPYGRARLKIPELMYPPGHPYHNTVIGSHEEIQAATVQDVKEFFARYYVPNNATLVVAGDFDPKVIKPLIAKLFGTLPRGADPGHAVPKPAALDEVRRVTYYDQVQFAKILFLYHSPALFQPGDAEMDLVSEILAGGKSSRLYKRLVYEDKLATEVSAGQQSQLLGSLFRVEVTARQGVSLDKIEQIVDEVLAQFLKNGPTTAELERDKAKFEYANMTQLQSLLAKADKLNAYEAGYGEPNSFKRDLDRYRNATVASVKDWARKVLTPNARLIMRVLPEEENTASLRDTRPEGTAGKEFGPAPPETFKLSNGVEVRLWRRSELPLVNVKLLLKNGASQDEAAQAGRTYLMAAMLDEGAGNLGALEFGDALDQLGASLSASCSQESTTVDLSVLKRNLGKGLALYADAILRPRFDAKEWDRVKTLHLQDLKQAEDQPTLVASRVGMSAFFGDDHPYGRPVSGTVDSVERLNLDSIKQAYARLFQPEDAMLFVAGDITKEEARAALEKSFGGWKSTAGAASAGTAHKASFPKPANDSLKVVIVDKPGAVQTVVRFYMPAPNYKDPQRIARELLNTILGGSFTSRLNQNLREEKGFTYGASSRFVMGPSAGYFVAGSDIQAEHTGEAIKEFLAEFKRLRAGDVSKEEAGKSQQTKRLDYVQSFEGLAGVLNTAANLEENGLPFSTLGDDLAAIGTTTDADLNKLAGPAIPLEQAVLVLVGDKKTILEQLKGLDLPTPVELTVEGDVKK